MENKYEELSKKILNFTTKEEVIKYYSKIDSAHEDFVRNGGSLANKALTHMAILLTPEDYDDDICD